MTANSSHPPSGMAEALDRATADLRLVLPKAAENVATTMAAMERNLDAILKVVEVVVNRVINYES